MLDAGTGQTLFVRETVDETYVYAGGASVRLKGFILHFHHGSLPVDRQRIAALLQPPVSGGSPAAGVPVAGVPVAGTPAVAVGPAVGNEPVSVGPVAGSGAGPAAGSDAASIPAAGPAAIAPPVAGAAFEMATGERGVVLLLYDLRFVADGDELLAGERGRLDAIADALKRIPDRTFLVEGHTADLGRPAGQYELSERRARRIVNELVARGIPAGRFIYRGLGADKPLAPNDTETNRARNRRVEITVLD
jgi:outer membrane protein OmpA-like peptidoglycan-associated protein